MSETATIALLGLVLLLLAAGFAVGGAIFLAMAGAGADDSQWLSGWSARVFLIAYAVLLLAGVVAPVAVRLSGAGWVGVAATAAGCFFAAVVVLVAFLATRFEQ